MLQAPMSIIIIYIFSSLTSSIFLIVLVGRICLNIKAILFIFDDHFLYSYILYA